MVMSNTLDCRRWRREILWISSEPAGQTELDVNLRVPHVRPVHRGQGGLRIPLIIKLDELLRLFERRRPDLPDIPEFRKQHHQLLVRCILGEVENDNCSVVRRLLRVLHFLERAE